MSRMRVSLLFVSIFLFVLSGIFPTHFIIEASEFSQDSTSYQNYLKGLLFDRIGEYGLAKDAYLKALRSDFGSWDIHYRLGLNYLRLNDLRNAENEFKYVLKLRPHEEKIRFLLALVYSYSSKFREAEEEFSGLLSQPLLELDQADIRNYLGHIYLSEGNLDKARTQYSLILKNNPNDSDAHFYLGYVYHELSKTDIAVEEFIKAIELNSLNTLALNSLSYLYAQRGQNLDKALVLVKKALEIEPSNGAYLDTLGWVYFKKGDLENALRYLENASVLMVDAEIFEHLGDVHLELGQINEAKKNWYKALEIEPKRQAVRDKIRKLKEKK